MSYTFDPLVPRPIDRPTEVAPGPLTAELSAALDEAKIFSGPADPADRPAWRETLHAWRDDSRARHAYTGAAYARPEATWAARCHTVAQVWLWDELLYSFEESRFTPERFLSDAGERFGGLDAVVLWHAYPVIGLDDRNQWDYYRDVPGLAGLVETLHEAGLHVFVDYNPWDVGTRRGADDLTELAAVVGELGADGVFLDTLKKAEPELVARLEAARPGIVLEGESKLPVERIEDHSSSVPGVLRGAGTGTTPRSCSRPGSTEWAPWSGRSCSACGWAGPAATPRRYAAWSPCSALSATCCWRASGRPWPSSRPRPRPPGCTPRAGSWTASRSGRW